ncbi:hypothetical protein V5T82_06455 [Magnetovibrio sp. PR-2]|uniref:hypothetical protein n=1 Tax=Magnetovibrio sp. PR-2 TaxID=3120356 RepID=UPI002FCE68F4
MYPTNNEVLDTIVDCIHNGQFLRAYHLWSSYNQVEHNACENCLYKQMRGFEDCCMCLETKLRTLNLYEDNHSPFGHSLSLPIEKLTAHNKRHPLQ